MAALLVIVFTVYGFISQTDSSNGYYLGCYQHVPIDNSIYSTNSQDTLSNTTVEVCFEHCQNNGKRYAGLWNVYRYLSSNWEIMCECAEDYGLYGECNNIDRHYSCCERKCEEDYYCGDNSSIAIYDILEGAIACEGCFNISEDLAGLEFYLNQKNLTLEECKDWCQNEGYIYVGLANYLCHCGAHIKKSNKLPAEYCEIKCEGNSDFPCDGYHYLVIKVFRTNLESLKELHEPPVVVKDINEYVKIHWLDIPYYYYKLQYWDFNSSRYWQDITFITYQTKHRWLYNDTSYLQPNKIYKLRVLAFSHQKKISGPSLIFRSCPAFESEVYIRDVTSSMAIVTWDALDGIEDYFIKLWTNEEITSTFKISSNNFILQKLKPFTNYKLQVVLKAQSLGQEQKCSKASRNITFQTLCTKPSSAPWIKKFKTSLNSIHSNIRAAQLCLNWKMQGNINCKRITSLNYLLIDVYKDNHYQSVVILNDYQQKGGNFCIEHLEMSSEYDLCIEVENNEGFHSPASEEIRILTPDEEPSSPRSIYLVSRSITSLNIRWEPPQNTSKKITRYKIDLFAIKTENGNFKTKKILVKCNPIQYFISELLDASQTQFKFKQLFPATLYNVSIYASTTGGFGLPISKVYWTLIEDPPLPLAPQLDLSQSTKTTITLINLHPMEKIFGGPLIAYQLVVNTVPQSAVFNTTLLFDYYIAAEKQLPYYITAEIHPDNLNATFVIGNGLYYGNFYNAPLISDQEYEILYGAVSSLDQVVKSSFIKAKKPRVVYQYIPNHVEKASLLVMSGVAGFLSFVVIISLSILIIVRKRSRLVDYPKPIEDSLDINRNSHRRVLVSNL